MIMQEHQDMLMSLDSLLKMVDLRRLFAYVRDRLYGGERQLMIINALHDIDRGFSMINQYGDVSTVEDLGSL